MSTTLQAPKSQVVGGTQLLPKRAPGRPHIVSSTLQPWEPAQIVAECRAGREVAQIAKDYNCSQHLVNFLWNRNHERRLIALERRLACVA